MKRNNFAAAKQKPVPELEKELRELRARMSNLRFDLSAGKVKNLKEMKLVKKSIAQLLTVVRERSMREAAK